MKFSLLLLALVGCMPFFNYVEGMLLSRMVKSGINTGTRIAKAGVQAIQDYRHPEKYPEETSSPVTAPLPVVEATNREKNLQEYQATKPYANNYNDMDNTKANKQPELGNPNDGQENRRYVGDSDSRVGHPVTNGGNNLNNNAVGVIADGENGNGRQYHAINDNVGNTVGGIPAAQHASTGNSHNIVVSPVDHNNQAGGSITSGENGAKPDGAKDSNADDKTWKEFDSDMNVFKKGFFVR